MSLADLTKKGPFIVAEISANHNGSLKKALQTISAAKKCGADAVKIQTYTPDTMTMNLDRDEFIIQDGPWAGQKLYDLYKLAQTPYEWHKPIFEHAKKEKICIFSTPFDKTAVDLLESLNTPFYKIASFELVDLPLLKYVAKTGKPIIMSTGMASEEEIFEAVDTIRASGCRELALLHCISSYPAPMNEIRLRQIPELAKRFNTLVGLSDHTMGETAAVAAVALGALIIEKHFTLCRKSKGPDSAFSSEPSEFRSLSSKAKDAWSTLGKAGFGRPQIEGPTKYFRRSLFFAEDLPAQHIIRPENICSLRPGIGLEPKYLEKIINQKLSKPVKKGDPVQWKTIKKFKI